MAPAREGPARWNVLVAQSLADDPRFVLWQHTFERIRERPWTGFGYGKSILAEELRGEQRLRRVLGPVQLSALGVGAGQVVVDRRWYEAERDAGMVADDALLLAS